MSQKLLQCTLALKSCFLCHLSNREGSYAWSDTRAFWSTAGTFTAFTMARISNFVLVAVLVMLAAVMVSCAPPISSQIKSATDAGKMKDIKASHMGGHSGQALQEAAPQPVEAAPQPVEGKPQLADGDQPAAAADGTDGDQPDGYTA